MLAKSQVNVLVFLEKGKNLVFSVILKVPSFKTANVRVVFRVLRSFQATLFSISLKSFIGLNKSWEVVC
jgi:hypothetical protein